jgi:hypothetical protein
MIRAALTRASRAAGTNGEVDRLVRLVDGILLRCKSVSHDKAVKLAAQWQLENREYKPNQ